MRFVVLLVLFTSCAHKDPFTTTRYGRVHTSCLTAYGKEFVELLGDSLEKGLSCLSSLDGDGSRKNAEKLRALITEKKIAYVCDEKDYSWNTAIAHASMSSLSDRPDLNLHHPFVSVRPGTDLFSPDGFSRSYRENIFFHEHLHLLGYAHNVDAEYAYACEDCCMNTLSSTRALDQSYKELSCKICRTSYTSVADPEYLKDYRKWLSYKTATSLNWDITIRIAVMSPVKHSVPWNTFFERRKREDLSYVFLGKFLKKDRLHGTFDLPEPVKVSPALRATAFRIAELEEDYLLGYDVVKTAREFQTLELSGLKQELRLNKDTSSADYKVAISLQGALVADLYVLADTIESIDFPLSQDLWSLYFRVLEFSGSGKKL